jgi:hypothetical protein
MLYWTQFCSATLKLIAVEKKEIHTCPSQLLFIIARPVMTLITYILLYEKELVHDPNQHSFRLLDRICTELIFTLTAILISL